MDNPAAYSVAELCKILKSAFLVIDALDGTEVDVVTAWIEQAEHVASQVADELESRAPADEVEEQERTAALSAYRARLEHLPEDLNISPEGLGRSPISAVSGPQIRILA